MRRGLVVWLSLLPLLAGAQEWQPGIDVRVYDLGRNPGVVPLLAEDTPPNAWYVAQSVDWKDDGRDFGGLKDNFATLATARLTIPETGFYDFRLASDDGSLLWLNGQLVIDHDGLHGMEPKTATLYLYRGTYDLRLEQFEGGGGAGLRLEWKLPGGGDFRVLGAAELTAPAGLARRTAPGTKPFTLRQRRTPGNGAPVEGVHPDWELRSLRPEGFQPQVVSLAWLADQELLVAAAGETGTVWRVRLEGGQPQVARLAELPDLLGVSPVGGQPVALTARDSGPLAGARLAALTGNRLYLAGPAVVDGVVYAVAGPADVAGAPRCELVRLAEGTATPVLGGLFEPTGVAPGGRLARLVACDQAGGDGPGGRLVAWSPGADGQWRETLVAWLPGAMIDWPTQPAVAPDGPSAGQVFVGDLRGGGIRRLFVESAGGRYNAALLRFTQGLEAGVHRLAIAPDGTLAVGMIGGSATFGQLGRPGYGLQALAPKATTVFEIRAVRVLGNGLEIEFSRPVTKEAWEPFQYRVFASTVEPGGRLTDQRRLPVDSASVIDNGRRVFLHLPDLTADTLLHLQVAEGLPATGGGRLWSPEAWVTVGYLPPATGTILTPPEGALPNTLTAAERAAGWRLLFDGKTVDAWRGYNRQDFPANGWLIEDGALHCLGGRGGDIITREQFESFELALEWRVTVGSNSGVMYRVIEQNAPSWHSGPEVQVHDEAPGTMHKNSAGSLYDLFAPRDKELRPRGQWNEMRLIVRGNRVEHWLNGTQVLTYEIDSPQWQEALNNSKFKDLPQFAKNKRGHLCLQDHGQEVWYRNLKIRVLEE